MCFFKDSNIKNNEVQFSLKAFAIFLPIRTVGLLVPTMTFVPSLVKEFPEVTLPSFWREVMDCGGGSKQRHGNQNPL